MSMVKCAIPQFHALKHVIGDLRAFLETTKHVCKLDKPRHIEVSVMITVDEAMFFRRRREDRESYEKFLGKLYFLCDKKFNE